MYTRKARHRYSLNHCSLLRSHYLCRRTTLLPTKNTFIHLINFFRQIILPESTFWQNNNIEQADLHVYHAMQVTDGKHLNRQVC